ncbi:sulfotransferase family 2 domain-containing protein [Rhizobium sp. EC-SD404]|uniref:sulfotransferase family 2 domain-containing protein n=1 Tax=Rhizobium sp. EC-SD404 TaxID=2038389 RepID=UPI0012570BBA|nr:sulfotransferase family 2 domain-containing protein [Rhizobium sp. EC-SD404]VVT34310.1 Sulfotransferase family protein [Rhizobium sp. EC-SD404]
MPFIEYNEKRVLFIHIPKTGGTTVEGWLGGLSHLHFHSVGVPAFSKCTPQHYRMQDFRALFGDQFFDFSFCFVRNPYDRLESEFRMQATIQKTGFWRRHSSFSTWLDGSLEIARQNAFHLDNHLRPQWEFIGSGVRVLRLEDGLETGLAEVAAFLGEVPPANLGKENSTSNSEIRVDWDLQDRCKIEEFYRRDFEQFGYAVIR